MPASISPRRRWTAPKVRRLIAESPLATPRYELVAGELLVTPSPSPRHQAIVTRLSALLDAYLDAHPIGRVLVSPSDVELEPDSVAQPDLYVVPRDEFRRLAAASSHTPARDLLLAVEVLSPASARYDRVTKRPLYQRHVPEYWIVDVDARLIERWRRGDERPELLTGSMVWQPLGAAGPLVLALGDLFAKALDE